MSQLFAHLLFLLCFPLGISSSSSTNISPSPTVSASPRSSGTAALSSVLSPAPTVSASPRTSGTAASSSVPSPAVSSSVSQPSGSSTIRLIVSTRVSQTPSQTPSVSTLKSNPTTTPKYTGPTGAKGKTIGTLEIVGLCLVGVLVTLVSLFAIYYFFFRKKWYPEYWTKMEPEAGKLETDAEAGKVTVVTVTPGSAADKKMPEVGVTHRGFVGDSESKVPPVNFHGPEARNGVAAGSKQEAQSAENAGLSEDSAL
ncbi:serine-rich adhesin for platelets-like [Montipora capricornis]|uniref:serine-rich adhesin for platelets-like n=1 Tax=Montipora capricornis TaxID=246305 RepID=UPI0035F0FB5C